ncbi:MAG: acyltransferase, partial [Chloroflexales bacterium]|nr:acyltransferase [Chloroflexales bacterium]
QAQTLLSALLGWGPLRWIGVRSYSIYLWHWPVLMTTRPQLDVSLAGAPLLACQIVVTLGLAEFSYRIIEKPFRQGIIARSWRHVRIARGREYRRRIVAWAGAFGTIGALVVVLSIAVTGARPAAPPDYLAMESIRIVASTPVVTMLALPDQSDTMDSAATVLIPVALAPLPSEPAPTPTALPSDLLAPPLSAPLGARPEWTPTPNPTPRPLSRVTAVGDSVMLGAAAALAQVIPNLDLDAAVSRGAAPAIDILRAQRDAGQLGDAVIIHIGNNGPLSAKQFDELMQVVVEAPRVLIVNVKIPRAWEKHNNDILSAGLPRYPNAVLVDWRGASSDRPELFWGDGIHLRPEGARFYTELITAQLAIPWRDS